jgi:trans-2,3-dihydro-3-hydroxyanthranilate isomerase
MRKFPYIQTSVFIDDRQLSGGNQLATFWDFISNESLKTDEMQKIALEINFSETTFVFRPSERDFARRVRIFTPEKEIPFAGHPTLGTAFVLKYRKIIRPSVKSTVLELGAGPVSVDFLEDDRIQMSQPAAKFVGEISDPTEVLSSIGLGMSDMLEGFPVEVVSTGLPFLIIPLKSKDAVVKAVPDADTILASTKNLPSQEILIFSPEALNEGRDIHARMFAPGVGVLEDPATGSAAGPLGAYVEKHRVLNRKETGATIYIEQGYEINRPSLLEVRVPSLEDEILVSGKVKMEAEEKFILP